MYNRCPPLGILWFWSLVFARSRGNVAVIPTIPAMPPFISFGMNLNKENVVITVRKVVGKEPASVLSNQIAKMYFFSCDSEIGNA